MNWKVAGISAISSQATSATPASTTSTPARTTPASTATSGAATATFPPVGSIPRDFSPQGLERLWDLVGPVEPPPFTTTRVPTSTSVVEGAVKNEGKGPTVWDWNSRQPGGVVDNTTADVEDVLRVAALGIPMFGDLDLRVPRRISWARIFPFGTADSPVNQEAIKHYSDLIDYHIQHGVAPVATLFHWDTPLALSAYYGGFTSPQVVDDFIHYAKTVFAAYNGRVKTWYTFNEPRVFCGQTAGYPFNVSLAPGVNSSTAPYQCAYNLPLRRAHIGPVPAFREMKIQGEIALKNDDFIGIPWRSNTSDDALAVERHVAFRIGVFSDPLYTTGDWPKIMTDTLPPDYLPRFTEQEKKDNLGSADFFAIDSYREQFITAPLDGLDACVSNTSHPLWPECHSAVLFDSNAGWAAGISPDPLSESWLQATPNTLRTYLKGVQTRWPTKKMVCRSFCLINFTDFPYKYIHKCSYARTFFIFCADYFMTYLGQILLSIHEDKVPIMGAFAWAMIDNAEWGSGLSAKFGIQHVNYTTLERTYKRSAFSLSEFFQAHLQSANCK
ncbi:glycoside hydrolase superfamily [Mycena olivaceomarginata]|nr:glycoside hydrolase superfamily [Mycena olivaceomarginata]